LERPVRSKFNTQIYEEACEWLIECRAGDLDSAARAEFDRWLRKSPEHHSAYLEIAAIWNEGPALDPANRWSPDELLAQAAEDPANIIALELTRSPSHTPQSVPNSPETDESPADTVLPSTRQGRGSSPRRLSLYAAPTGHRRLFAIAASILLATTAAATYVFMFSGSYATALGEQRSLALSDGSTVQLNSLSRIRIRYTEHERTVDLLQGQALFHVAKDSTRPFIVYSGQTRVKAVGTQFDVYRKDDGTIVTVVEGRVAILGIPELPNSSPHFPGVQREEPAAREEEGSNGSTRHANERHLSILKHEGERVPQSPESGSGIADVARGEGEGAIFLTAGEQITVSPQAVRKTVHPNLAGATSWTQRQLVFDSASLADVAEELNRYNERKLVIDQSALGALHISGVFSSTDPASLIRFLRDRPGLRITETRAEIRVEKDQ
jgi:transmembrane sensor